MHGLITTFMERRLTFRTSEEASSADAVARFAPQNCDLAGHAITTIYARYLLVLWNPLPELLWALTVTRSGSVRRLSS